VSADIHVGAARRERGVQRFEVRVDGRRHDVTVSDRDAADLPSGAGPSDLVRESFRFLLEREPASSILQRFDLSVIERYFPDYRAAIRKRLSR